MFIALRFLGLLDVLSSTPAGASVARLVSMPVCAASRQNLVRKAGLGKTQESPNVNLAVYIPAILIYSSTFCLRFANEQEGSQEVQSCP
jgi:hypothetical protein